MSGVICREEPKLAERFLFVRVSSKHLKRATSCHQNNARGLLENISSFTAERFISHKDLLKYQRIQDIGHLS
jgi:hypothetical protein